MEGAEQAVQALFITVEGGEGVGKSVFIRGLSEALLARGISLMLTREPGGTPLADGIRQLFLHPPNDDKPSSITELLLVSAARSQHVATRILPCLARGQWVLCDRFYDSTRVYQGSLGGLAAEVVEQVLAYSVAACHPQLTFLLDCSTEIAMQRIERREQALGLASAARNRYDAGSLVMHQRLRAAYQELAQRFAERIVVIDAESSPQSMVSKAMQQIERKGWL